MKVIASHNGLAAVRHAYELLQQEAAPLDACVEGVALIEDDPADVTVGYGGLPNEDGVVELDAAVMDGRAHRGGAVAALRGIRNPVRVARLVMRQTNRVLLVGEGAKRFALANGFQEENLLTEQARQMWMYWKRRRSTCDDWVAPPDDESLDLQTWYDRHFYPTGENKITGTVHCAAIDRKNDLACCTSTSGHAFKLAGRVGDSPILGAGLYVDNEVGSCGSIGHGEANLENLSSFAVVEAMRRGASPVEAGLDVLKQVVRKSQSRVCDADGRPLFNLQLFILHKDGRHAGVALWGPKPYALADENGARLEECTALYEGNGRGA